METTLCHYLWWFLYHEDCEWWANLEETLSITNFDFGRFFKAWQTSSSWYHSTVGLGSPVAWHSKRNPLELENRAWKYWFYKNCTQMIIKMVTWSGGSFIHSGGSPIGWKEFDLTGLPKRSFPYDPVRSVKLFTPEK